MPSWYSSWQLLNYLPKWESPANLKQNSAKRNALLHFEFVIVRLLSPPFSWISWPFPKLPFNHHLNWFLLNVLFLIKLCSSNCSMILNLYLLHYFSTNNLLSNLITQKNVNWREKNLWNFSPIKQDNICHRDATK